MDSFWGTPLHEAAERGSPEVVAELPARAGEVDVLHEGRTPLWLAVFGERPDNALALAEAGADPWQPMMAGWSPGRLALATPDPDLFGPPPTGVSRYLDETEALAVAQARELVAVLDDRYFEGASVMCVANVDAAEAIRRLQAEPVEDDGTDEMADILEDPWSYDFEEIGPIVGVSDVPGGCVVTQPWGHRASSPAVGKLLSVGTVGYGVFSNAKSGNQGDIVRTVSSRPGISAPAAVPSRRTRARKRCFSAFSIGTTRLRTPSRTRVCGRPTPGPSRGRPTSGCACRTAINGRCDYGAM
jgi:hypothetical protein